MATNYLVYKVWDWIFQWKDGGAEEEVQGWEVCDIHLITYDALVCFLLPQIVNWYILPLICRFGLPTPSSDDTEAKKKARLERFGQSTEVGKAEEEKRKARALR